MVLRVSGVIPSGEFDQLRTHRHRLASGREADRASRLE